MKIGILGGTFDPPHAGHLALANAALEQLELDEVLFLPANKNPLKSRKVQTPPKHRTGMVEALIREEPRFAYSDMEITRGGPSYTVDTLMELQMARPAEYWLLMGADSLKSLPDWKHPHRIVKMARLGVVVRPPMNALDVLSRVPEEYKERVDIIPMKPIDISSTELRDRLTRHQNVASWIPNDVLKYIYTHRLYSA